MRIGGRTFGVGLFALALTAGTVALQTPADAAVHTVAVATAPSLTSAAIPAVGTRTATARTAPATARTVRGSLTRSRDSLTRRTRVRAGATSAVVTFAARCGRVQLTLSQRGRVVAKGSGATGLAIAGRTRTGRLTVRVAGSGCRTGVRVALRTQAAPRTPTLATARAAFATSAVRAALVLRPSAAGTASHRARVASGPVTAVTSFDPACRTASVTLTQAGRVVAAGVGGSGLALAGRVARGRLTVKVTGGRCPTGYDVALTAPGAGTPRLTSTRRPARKPAPRPTPTPAPAPTPTPAPIPAPDPTPTVWTTPPVSVLDSGAVGDGTTDDTAAVQRALDSMVAGDTLTFPAGYTFRHTAVLKAAVSGTHLTGGGTLLATNEAASAFHIAGNDITVDGGLTFAMGATTRRWDAFEQMKLRVGWGTTGITISNVTIDGSAAAGLYVGAVSHFTITDVTVQNTRADGIHITGGSSYGNVVRPVLRNPGDDGVAIVSYKNDGAITHHITVASPRLYGQAWGRAFSVVGGSDITETDVYADSSNGGAIYIAAEAEFNTYGCTRVTFDGGTLVRSNTNSAVDHGAVMLYSSQAADNPNRDITVANLTIKDTRATASRQVSVIGYGTAVQDRVRFANLTLVGGNKYLYGGLTPASGINRTGWTWNGARTADVVTWR